MLSFVFFSFLYVLSNCDNLYTIEYIFLSSSLINIFLNGLFTGKFKAYNKLFCLLLSSTTFYYNSLRSFTFSFYLNGRLVTIALGTYKGAKTLSSLSLSTCSSCHKYSESLLWGREIPFSLLNSACVLINLVLP